MTDVILKKLILNKKLENFPKNSYFKNEYCLNLPLVVNFFLD